MNAINLSPCALADDRDSLRAATGMATEATPAAKDDGGPAFPATQEHGCNAGVSGMTLRDYFAAKSLQGILASGAEYDAEGISAHAYALAGAMLAERAKGGAV